MHAGRFVTLEGGEGVGKSTLVRGLASALRARGLDVLTTREPGGSAAADEIRALLVRGDAGWTAMEEALLFAAARSNHLRETIRPALERGAWVICDRFSDSTRAYQVAAGGVEADALDALTRMIGAPDPHLTLILDADPSLGLGRSRGAALGEDRFERRDITFHERVRAAFLEIAAAAPKRCVVLDASQPAERVLHQALAAIEERL